MPDQPSDFVLQVNGQRYDGWTSIEVTTSLDAMCGALEAETTDRFPGHPEQWPIQTGNAYKILIDGELRQTGWIDVTEPDEDETKHTIKIEGRGRTCDLVDCSALNKPGHWTNASLVQIITDLCKPFGISVTAVGDMGDKFAKFALQQGEAVKDAIDRLVQQRGVLPFETPTGDLQLVNPSADRAAGQLIVGPGGNCKGSAKHDAKERFSTYVVKGSRKGSNHEHGKTVAQVTGEASDPQVTRYRPLMIMAEDQATGTSAATRAKFAATVRAGKAQTGKLRKAGVRDDTGALWKPNCLVAVNAPNLGLMGDLLIKEVKLKKSGAGSSAEIDVIRPEAYSLGEVKGVGLSRLDNSKAGRGMKARSGRGRGRGRGKGPGIAALGDLPS